MPVHFRPPFGHLTFLFLQLLGLPLQPGRGGRDLLGLFLDLGLPALQLGRAVQQRLLHFADAALPVDQLLAEGGHGQAMFVAGHVQGEFLLAHALGLGLDVLTGGFEVVAALAGVAVDLGQMLAQLLARPQQPVHADGRPRLQVRQPADQLQRLGAGRLELAPRPLRRLVRRLSFHLEGDPFRRERLPLAAHGIAGLFQMLGLRPLRFLVLGQVVRQPVQLGGAVGQLLAQRLQFGRLTLVLQDGRLRLLLRPGRLQAALGLLFGYFLLTLV